MGSIILIFLSLRLRFHANSFESSLPHPIYLRDFQEDVGREHVDGISSGNRWEHHGEGGADDEEVNESEQKC